MGSTKDVNFKITLVSAIAIVFLIIWGMFYLYDTSEISLYEYHEVHGIYEHADSNQKRFIHKLLEDDYIITNGELESLRKFNKRRDISFWKNVILERKAESNEND